MLWRIYLHVLREFEILRTSSCWIKCDVVRSLTTCRVTTFFPRVTFTISNLHECTSHFVFIQDTYKLLVTSKGLCQKCITFSYLETRELWLPYILQYFQGSCKLPVATWQTVNVCSLADIEIKILQILTNNNQCQKWLKFKIRTKKSC